MHSIFCTESNLRREVKSKGSKELLRVSVKCLKKLASSLEIPPYEKMLKMAPWEENWKVTFLISLSLWCLYIFIKQNYMHPSSRAPRRTGSLHGNHIVVVQFCPLPHPVYPLSCLSIQCLPSDFCLRFLWAHLKDTYLPSNPSSKGLFKISPLLVSQSCFSLLFYSSIKKPQGSVPALIWGWVRGNS